MLVPLLLRLIHSGRLLTDGILLLAWLRSLEERVRRQAAGVGGDVESVLKEVGLTEDDSTPANGNDSPGNSRVWLHCNVGGRMDEKPVKPKEEGDEVRFVSLRFRDHVHWMGYSLLRLEGGDSTC